MLRTRDRVADSDFVGGVARFCGDRNRPAASSQLLSCQKMQLLPFSNAMIPPPRNCEFFKTQKLETRTRNSKLKIIRHPAAFVPTSAWARRRGERS